MPSAPELSVKSRLKAGYLNLRGVALKTLGLPFSRGKERLVPRDVRRILCIRIDRVGDMVLSTPTFQAIKRAWPQARLTILSSPANAPILENNPHVDDVIIYDHQAGLVEKIRQILQIRAFHFDLAIDLHADEELQTALLAAMSRSKHRIGYAGFGREAFLNGSLVNVDKHKHVVDAMLALLRQNGIASPKSGKPVVYLSADEREWAGRWLDGHGLCGKVLIAVHPGAYYETQRWPIEYYAGLIDLMCQQTQWEVILLGGSSDAKVIDEILTRCERDISAYVQNDMRKFLAILSRCQMLVCNNSGPLHCAAALNIPTLSFMGPTVKELWMPMGEGHRVLRLDDLPCIGCNSGRCRIKTHDCMRMIGPEAAFKIIQKELFPLFSGSGQVTPEGKNYRQTTD